MASAAVYAFLFPGLSHPVCILLGFKMQAEKHAKQKSWCTSEIAEERKS
jgi:hypothetical protein